VCCGLAQEPFFLGAVCYTTKSDTVTGKIMQVGWVRFKLSFNQQKGVVLTRLALAKPWEELARSYLAGYVIRSKVTRPGKSRVRLGTRSGKILPCQVSLK
jgi:hypothetical protein